MKKKKKKNKEAGSTVIKTPSSGIFHTHGMIDLILGGKSYLIIVFCMSQISLRFSRMWDLSCLTQLHIAVMFCLMTTSLSCF